MMISDEIIIIGFSIFLIILLGLLLLLLKFLKIFKLSYWGILEIIIFKIPITLAVIFIIGYLANIFFTSPMTVRKIHLESNYIIDREMFKGKDADWQYNHYALKIDEDTLYLRILNNNRIIKTFKKHIFYVDIDKHRFITFQEGQYSDEFMESKEIDRLSLDTSKHHMLRLNPKLMSNPFSFRIILQSTKYGNMFFKKGKWKPLD